MSFAAAKMSCSGSPSSLASRGWSPKETNSVYESRWRNGAWVKFKITRSQEFVIGGYTLP
jgi:hypothetical protein